MRYETLHGVEIPKVGFGTWSLGGKQLPDPSSDAWSLTALHSALEMGYTHFDTAEMYARGHCEELVGRAIRESGIPRENLFITSKVWPDHLRYEDALRSCENSLRRLGMEYLDLYLIHWPMIGVRLEETFRALNQLVREGRVRHLGVSNFKLKQLNKAASLCETQLLTNQVPYCLPDPTYVKNGVLNYCQQNDILLTAYSPLKHRYVAGNKALNQIALNRGITAQQAALSWLTSQPRVITIPMSANPQHQLENLQAADILLGTDEMELLGR